MTKNIDDEQLKTILDQIIRDYHVTLMPAGWQQLEHHEKIHRLLIDQQLLVMVTSKPDHHLITAYHECHANIAGLYDFLVSNLFTRVARQPLEARPYEADNFLVLAFSGPAGHVLEAIGQAVIPFVSQYYGQSLADPWQNHQAAARVLKMLGADDQDAVLRAGVINRINPLRIQRLQPLAMVNRMQPKTASVTANGHEQPELQAAAVAGKSASPTVLPMARRNRRCSRTAPLPGYFRSDDTAE